MKTRHQLHAEAAAELFEQNAINDYNGSNGTRFLSSLPVEVTVKIASYLNQRDCLICMAVCRSWHISAPQCMQRVWNRVYVSYGDVSRFNTRWERCVRDYAKCIVVSDTNYSRLHFILRKLVGYHCRQVDSVEMAVPENLSKARINALLVLLKNIGDHTTRLALNDIYTEMNVLDAISIFTDLTQLSYVGVYVNWRVHSFTSQPVLPQFTRLTYLYLDFPINMKFQLEPILRNSPNLQNLTYGERRRTHILARPAPHTVTKLEDISSWCQKLMYLESGAGQLSKDYRTTSLAYVGQNKSTYSGLRCFMTSQSAGYEPDQVASHLLRNASTLEFIGFEYIPDRFPVMNQLRTPQLRMLVLHMFHRQNHASETPWDIVLPECPVLEHLSLHGDEAVQLDLSVLTKLKQLNHLELSCLTLRCDSEKLKTWALRDSKISSIKLGTVHSVDDMLLELIAHFSMLKRLQIGFRYYDDYSDKGLLRFANQLRQTTVQQIVLNGIARVHPLFLQAVGDLSTLQSFTMRGAASSSLQVDASAIIKMFEDTSSLENVQLGGIKTTGSTEDIATFLEQRLHGYKVRNVAEPHLPVELVTLRLTRC